MVDDRQNPNVEMNEQNAQKDYTIVKTDEEALKHAVKKWVHFQRAIWKKINYEMIDPSKSLALGAILLRLTIIVLAATVTTLSGLLPEDLQGIVTVLAGLLTAITGIEAYFKFSERISQNKRQQRELEAKRDELRYRWFIDVEMETDMKKRLKCAKDLLDSGPKEYNKILNSFAIETEETRAPFVHDEPGKGSK
jgi:hypothetical protein